MINLHFTDANYYGLNKLGPAKSERGQKGLGIFAFFLFVEHTQPQTNRKWSKVRWHIWRNWIFNLWFHYLWPLFPAPPRLTARVS